MRTIFETVLAFLILIFIPSLAPMSFLFIAPIITCVQKEAFLFALWYTFFSSFIQASVLFSHGEQNNFLPLFMLGSLYAVILLLRKISCQKELVSFIMMFALSLGYLLYILTSAMEVSWYFILKSFVVSFSICMGIRWLSWSIWHFSYFIKKRAGRERI